MKRYSTKILIPISIVVVALFAILSFDLLKDDTITSIKPPLEQIFNAQNTTYQSHNAMKGNDISLNINVLNDMIIPNNTVMGNDIFLNINVLDGMIIPNNTMKGNDIFLN